MPHVSRSWKNVMPPVSRLVLSLDTGMHLRSKGDAAPEPFVVLHIDATYWQSAFLTEWRKTTSAGNALHEQTWHSCHRSSHFQPPIMHCVIVTILLLSLHRELSLGRGVKAAENTCPCLGLGVSRQVEWSDCHLTLYHCVLPDLQVQNTDVPLHVGTVKQSLRLHPCIHPTASYPSLRPQLTVGRV